MVAVTMGLVALNVGLACFVRPYVRELEAVERLRRDGLRVERETVFPDYIRRVVRKLAPDRFDGLCERTIAIEALEGNLDERRVESIVDDLNALPFMHILSINDNAIPLGVIGKLREGKRLRRLGIHRTYVNVEDCRFFHDLAGLEWLTVQDAPIGDRLLSECGRHDLLCRLDLSGTRVTLKGLDLAARFPNLERIVAYGIARGNRELNENGMPQLRELTVANSQINDADLAAIVAWAPRLRFLDVSNTAISDRGVRAVVSLCYLESLNISGTRTSDAVLDDLSSMRQLRLLVCNDTGFTREGLLRLFEQIPELVICGVDLSSSGRGSIDLWTKEDAGASNGRGVQFP